MNTSPEKVLRIGIDSDCVKRPAQSGFEIVDRAYLKSDIEEVVIDEGITGIGNEAFRQCRFLKAIVLPKSLTRIGRGAFWGCKRNGWFIGANAPINKIFLGGTENVQKNPFSLSRTAVGSERDLDPCFLQEKDQTHRSQSRSHLSAR